MGIHRARMVAVLLGVWLMAGCGQQQATGTGKPVVIPTTSLIHDALAHIAGDVLEVHAPLCGAADPHSYEATPGDIRQLTAADLVFYNGLGLEGHLEPMLKRLGKKAIAVTQEVPPARLLPWTGAEDAHGHHHHSAYDPHLWTDPETWMGCIRTMAEILAVQYPQHKTLFMANAETYLAEISRVHSAGLKAVEVLPQERRILISNHETFRYFARAYHFEVRALMGISPESEAGIRDVQVLADFIVARQVPTLFAEASLDKRTMEALLEAVRARGGKVALSTDPLYSEALGTEAPANTYPGMLAANLHTILKGLGAAGPTLPGLEP